MADITYSPSDDGTETEFSADTPAGEEYLGGPNASVPVTDAAAFIENGKAKGLTFAAFP